MYEVLKIFQSGCKILLSNLSQENIYIHLKQKGSNTDQFSMIDVISPKKCNLEMSKVNFLERMSSMVFDKFDF